MNSSPDQAPIATSDPVLQSFTMAGGVMVGDGLFSINFTLPFATLTVSKEGLVVQALWKRFEIERSTIRSIETHRMFFSTGIEINHESQRAPRFIVFWPIKLDWLVRELNARGYALSDGE